MRRFSKYTLWICFCGCLMLAACTSAKPTIATLTENGLTQTTHLFIRNDWDGLSDLAPINAHYDLRPSAEGFVGEATYEAGGYSSFPKLEVVEIAIPQAVMSEFLTTLAQIPLEAIEYEPTVVNDDYEYISFAFQTAAGEIEVRSYSLTPQNIPWEVNIGEDSYVISSGAPSEAFDKLRPYLQEEIQTAQIEALQAELYGE
ncbi:MAG: hypothetical protein KDE51_08750 [Anaerolineales bacterium]|nr:hypothetical protein [Anaerolineales bacterium]